MIPRSSRDQAPAAKASTAPDPSLAPAPETHQVIDLDIQPATGTVIQLTIAQSEGDTFEVTPTEFIIHIAKKKTAPEEDLTISRSHIAWWSKRSRTVTLTPELFTPTE